jgi:hypothetical protein
MSLAHRSGHPPWPEIRRKRGSSGIGPNAAQLKAA